MFKELYKVAEIFRSLSVGYGKSFFSPKDDNTLMRDENSVQQPLAPDRVTAPEPASTSTLAGEQSATPPHAAGEA